MSTIIDNNIEQLLSEIFNSYTGDLTGRALEVDSYEVTGSSVNGSTVEIEVTVYAASDHPADNKAKFDVTITAEIVGNSLVLKSHDVSVAEEF
ncbi:MAG: hypothetical protein HWE12_13795 [Oceanospirillaceae bacterium]|nr:hypothetical protein [Oceanospirillaceae bacterium]